MNKIKNQFSIKDLENLSGIKAHTIRIWEKRYEILTPSRTDSNIRYYDLKNFQKLLNVNLLYQSGLKISKIASLPEEDLLKEVRNQISKDNNESHYIDSLKLAMLSFDLATFENTYSKMILNLSFREVYINIFIPLLGQIGLLWQSESITPAHEHFISHLIKQKIHTNIERVQQITPVSQTEIFALYLPNNEIHELGLLYIQYELLVNGYKTIYLGQSVPYSNLNSIQEIYENITYISYFTVEPQEKKVLEYLNTFKKEILDQTENKLWVLGRNTLHLEQSRLPNNIFLFKNITDLLNKI